MYLSTIDIKKTFCTLQLGIFVYTRMSEGGWSLLIELLLDIEKHLSHEKYAFYLCY